MQDHLWTALVTLLALLAYFVITLNVGRNRLKHGVQVPATSGNPDFERAFRAQQNTLEQLVAFLPGLWVFSFFVSAKCAPILGGVWVLGRILYAIGYCLESNKRVPGFAIAMLAQVSLLLGGLYGVIKALIAATH